MYILFCGGGTAGHVEPALAIADLCKRRMPSLGIRFIGRAGGAENRRIEEAGYPLTTITISGLQRRLSLRQVRTVWQTLRCIQAVKRQLKADPPALVVGTGGYVCFPVIYAASSLGIPTVLHESNATPGLTVRMLSRRVDTLLVNLPLTDKRLSKGTRIERVGMPVRSDIASISRAQARRSLGLKDGEQLIVSFGGSLGAERINDVCLRLMASISEKHPSIHHIHGCGKRYYEALARSYPHFCTEGARCRIYPYLDQMPTLLRAADLVICRSGAATVAEVCAAAAPTIFIPSPHVTEDHQYKNAKYLADADACRLLREDDLTQEALEKTVRQILGDGALRARMRKVIHTFYDPMTDERIYRALLPHLSTNSAQK